MKFSSRWALGLFSVLVLGLLGLGLSGNAQQKEPEKLPPINPSQARLEQTFKGLDGPGFAIVANRDGSLVAAACDRNTIQLWSKDVLFGIRSGDSSANVLKGHQGTVTGLAWNGGPVLASAGADKKILLWSLDTGKIAHTIDTDYLVRAMAMSSDGELLASGGDRTSLQLWDTGSGKLAREMKGHSDWVTCLAFSEDGKRLASGGYEGQALLWDVNSGNKVRELPKPAKKDPKNPPPIVVVSAVTFHPDGKSAAVGRANGEIQLVNTENGNVNRTLKGHSSAITGLAFHPEGELLVSCSKDGSIRLWNPSNGGTFKTLEDHKAWVEDVAFLSQGTLLASVGADQTVRVWNLTNP